MSRTAEYDVIIAGGGPAGATAGYMLGTAGLTVLIIDKSVFPREKLCGGLITHKTVRLLERVFGESALSLKNKGIIIHESDGYEVRTRSSAIVRGKGASPFFFLDRSGYDHYLLEKARMAGADVIVGDGIRYLDVLKSEVTTVSGRRFSAGFIIGADGVNSRIRRSFATDLFGRHDWSGSLAAAFEIFPERNAVKKQLDHPVLYYGFVDWGYGWVFPVGDRLRVGMCALKKKNRKKVITAFRDFLSVMDIKGAHEEKMRGYVLPYGCFLPSPVFRNVLLVGDAAGFADPLLGEGIFYAQRSAELASQAILGAKQENMGISQRATDDIQKLTAAHYMRSLQKDIMPELVYAGKIQDTIFSCLKRFDYLPLRILMNMFGDMPIEAVHGIRSYRWMRKK